MRALVFWCAHVKPIVSQLGNPTKGEGASRRVAGGLSFSRNIMDSLDNNNMRRDPESEKTL
jgi:hypothetical protein